MGGKAGLGAASDRAVDGFWSESDVTAMRSIDGAIAYCLPLTKMSNPAGSPIERVEVLALGPDLPRHAYTGHLPAPYTTSTLVKITDADGADGLGQFDSDSYGAFDLAPLETLRTLAPRLIGRDPLERRRHVGRAPGPRNGAGHAGRALGARHRAVGSGGSPRRRPAA